MAAMGKKVTDAGGAIVEILAGDFGAKVDKTKLDAWVNTYKLPITTVKDPDNMMGTSLMALVQREYTYIVDCRTMKITNIYIGSIAGIGTSAAQTAMMTMLQLLGPKGG